MCPLNLLPALDFCSGIARVSAARGGSYICRPSRFLSHIPKFFDDLFFGLSLLFAHLRLSCNLFLKFVSLSKHVFPFQIFRYNLNFAAARGRPPPSAPPSYATGFLSCHHSFYNKPCISLVQYMFECIKYVNVWCIVTHYTVYNISSKHIVKCINQWLEPYNYMLRVCVHSVSKPYSIQFSHQL